MADKLLRVTLIDVGWGDSIFIEALDGESRSLALIDSNDTTYRLSSFMYIDKYFTRNEIEVQRGMFDFIMLSHFHTDHYQGLKRLFKEFGAEWFLYPRTIVDRISGHDLLRYATRYDYINRHQAVDRRDTIEFGPVNIRCLWPLEHTEPEDDENNNSAVLLLTLGEVSVVLSGDAEGVVWEHIADNIPDNTRFFKVPHHGSVNGTFHRGGHPWFDKCPGKAVLGISAHKYGRFDHPNTEVIDLFQENNRHFCRTDEQYHITFETNGKDSWIKYAKKVVV